MKAKSALLSSVKATLRLVVVLVLAASSACKRPPAKSSESNESAESRTPRNRSFGSSLEGKMDREPQITDDLGLMTSRSIMEAFSQGGASRASMLLSRLSPDDLRGLIVKNELASNRTLNGIAVVIFATKIGPVATQEDVCVIADARCDLKQIGIALSELFTQANASGNVINIGDVVSNFGGGAKRNKVIQSYFASRALPLRDVIINAKKLGLPEDVKSALTGAAQAGEWQPEDYSALLESGQEDMIPLFMRNGIYELADSGGFGVSLAEWKKIGGIEDNVKSLKVKSYCISEVGVVDPAHAVRLLGLEPPENQIKLISDPRFSSVIKRWTDEDPEKCLDFVVSSGLPESEANRLVGISVAQWIGMDSAAASDWVKSVRDERYYAAAATKIVN